MIPKPTIILVGAELSPADELQTASAAVSVHSARERSKTSGMAKTAQAKAANRFSVLNDFVDVTMRDLTHAERSVWLILFRDTRNGTARTAQADMARRAGVSVSTVQRALRRLEKKGLLKIVRCGNLRGGPSVYMVMATASSASNN